MTGPLHFLESAPDFEARQGVIYCTLGTQTFVMTRATFRLLAQRAIFLADAMDLEDGENLIAFPAAAGLQTQSKPSRRSRKPRKI